MRGGKNGLYTPRNNSNKGNLSLAVVNVGTSGVPHPLYFLYRKPRHTDDGKVYSHTYKTQAKRFFSLPLRFDICTGANVVLGGQHKFVVQHPLRLVVQYSGRVQLDHLVVLHCQIVPCTLQVGHLITQKQQIKK